MAYSSGSLSSDDDKYTGFDTSWDPYYSLEQLFTSFGVSETAAGSSYVQARGLPRVGFGAGGAGGFVGSRIAECPGPVLGRGAGGRGGAGKKKRKGKKKGKGNTQAPHQPTSRLPMTKILVPQSSESVEQGACAGVVAVDTGVPLGLGSSAGSAACDDTFSGGKKEIERKMVKGNAQASAPLLAQLPPDYASLSDLTFQNLSECSEDEYPEEDIFEGEYRFFRSHYEDDMDFISYHMKPMGYEDSDHYDDDDDYNYYYGYDYYDGDSSVSDDSDADYMAHCLRKIHRAKSATSGSMKDTQTPRDAAIDFCRECMQAFDSWHAYLLHTAFDHSSCGVCKNPWQDNLSSDVSRYDNEDHYKSSPNCLYNPKYGLGKIKITEVFDFEEDESQFLCPTCGECPGSRLALKQHYATAHTKCSSCKIQYDTQDNLCHHFRTSKVHLGKYCLLCKMVFSSKEGMRAHYTETHLAGPDNQVGEELFTCDACVKIVRSFPTEDELEAHLQDEHIRCFPCKREFGQKKSLYNHFADSSRHSFCAQCDSDFTSSMSLYQHDCPGKIAL